MEKHVRVLEYFFDNCSVGGILGSYKYVYDYDRRHNKEVDSHAVS